MQGTAEREARQDGPEFVVLPCQRLVSGNHQGRAQLFDNPLGGGVAQGPWGGSMAKPHAAAPKGATFSAVGLWPLQSPMSQRRLLPPLAPVAGLEAPPGCSRSEGSLLGP